MMAFGGTLEYKINTQGCVPKLNANYKYLINVGLFNQLENKIITLPLAS